MSQRYTRNWIYRLSGVLVENAASRTRKDSGPDDAGNPPMKFTRA